MGNINPAKVHLNQPQVTSIVRRIFYQHAHCAPERLRRRHVHRAGGHAICALKRFLFSRIFCVSKRRLWLSRPSGGASS
eukprot:536908-Pleurochrysis_carterae.AAC.1